MACLAATGFVGNPIASVLIDRAGARRTLLVGLVLIAGGAAALAEIRELWLAFRR
jgi:MFS family permease